MASESTLPSPASSVTIQGRLPSAFNSCFTLKRAAMLEVRDDIISQVRKRVKRFFSSVAFSVEIAMRVDRPAMKPLRYRVDRATQQRPMKWGLRSGLLPVSRLQPGLLGSAGTLAQGDLCRHSFHRNVRTIAFFYCRFSMVCLLGERLTSEVFFNLRGLSCGGDLAVDAPLLRLGNPELGPEG